MRIVRLADAEDMDPVQFQEACAEFMDCITFLFRKARLWTTSGTYSAAMLYTGSIRPARCLFLFKMPNAPVMAEVLAAKGAAVAAG